MEVAFVSEFDRRRMVFRRLVGDGGSFGWREGGSIPLDDTYCRLLTEGRLPPVIPDAGADGRVRGLEVTGEARIGSYVGVPIRFSDGSLYGTLCCVSHSPDPSPSGSATPGSWRCSRAWWPTRSSTSAPAAARPRRASGPTSAGS